MTRQRAGLLALFAWLLGTLVGFGSGVRAFPTWPEYAYDLASQARLGAGTPPIGATAERLPPDLGSQWQADSRVAATGAVESHVRLATETVDANVVMGRKGMSQTFVDDAGRSTKVKYGGEIQVAPGTNVPGIVNGRAYSGHAFDQMQARGIMPSVVDDAIATGVSAPSRGGTSVFYGAGNDVSVIVNSQGKVVTVSYGDLRP